MVAALAQTLPYPTPLVLDLPAEEMTFPACITGPRPIIHEPVEYSAWVLAFACFQMGWTVLLLSWRHWAGMLMLRTRMRISQALHSLFFAWVVAGFNFAVTLITIATATAIFIWR